MAKKDGTVPHISLFKLKHMRGWWPFTVNTDLEEIELAVSSFSQPFTTSQQRQTARTMAHNNNNNNVHTTATTTEEQQEAHKMIDT
jgi:hypothetical protein